jgi:hypothetical protein
MASFFAAAKATGRRWLATERDEATAVLARERMPGPPVFAKGGEEFGERGSPPLIRAT